LKVKLLGFDRMAEVERCQWPDPVRQAYLRPTWDLIVAYCDLDKAHEWQVWMLVAEWELSDGHGGSRIFFDALQAASEIEDEARSIRFCRQTEGMTIEEAVYQRALVDEPLSPEEFAEAWGRFQ
jgi:hypothetical protein